MWIDGTVSSSDRMFYAGTAGHHQHHSTLKANESESFSGQRAVVHLNVTLPRSHLTCLNCHNKCKTSRPVPTAVLSAEEKEGELFPDRPRPFISARLFVRLQYCMVGCKPKLPFSFGHQLSFADQQRSESVDLAGSLSGWLKCNFISCVLPSCEWGLELDGGRRSRRGIKEEQCKWWWIRFRAKWSGITNAISARFGN